MIRNLLLAGLAATAWLAAAESAAAQTLEYDCDTQAEHYSVLKAVQDGPGYTAGGTISLRETFAVKQYVTLGILEFEPVDKSWRARLGITSLLVDKKPVVMGTLEITRNGKAEAPQVLGSLLDYEKGKTYPISLTLGPDGGSATLGGHTVPVALQAHGKVEVSVVCSGGEYLFTDLKLGGQATTR
jgi:hypothetical protein